MNFHKLTAAINEQKIIPYSGVPLISTDVRGFNPMNLISFVDLTDNIIENNTDYNLYERVDPISGVYPVEYVLPEKFRHQGSGVLVITDRHSNSKLVDFTLPLFYQYQMMFDTYVMDPSLQDGFIIVRKNMESVVSADNYIFETRINPTASGRYNTSVDDNFQWDVAALNQNVITGRLLLPTREKDNFYTIEYNKYFNNSITQYHNELIYEKPLYDQNIDYTITASSIILTPNSRMASGAFIFVQKNMDSFITMKSPKFINDSVKDQPWNIQITCGEFAHSSGIFGGYVKHKVRNFNITDGSNVAPIDQPTIINKNIIKLNTYPIFDSGSGYPTYNINDTINEFTINGKQYINNITSIDYRNGYIYLNKDISQYDNINISYNFDERRLILVNTLDLNPMNTVNSIVDIALNNIGIVSVPSGTVFINNIPSPNYSWSNMAFYNLSDNPTGNFNDNNTIGYALETVSTNGILSGVIPSGSILMGIFSINSLTDNMIKTYDIRRDGGYNSNDVIMDASGWRGFSDIGFWDGEAFPQAGSILIQIPSGIYNNIKNVFDNSDYTIATSQFSKDYEKLIGNDTTKYDSRKQQVKTATDKYIKDTIERYLPVGINYIIVDEDFNIRPIRGD